MTQCTFATRTSCIHRWCCTCHGAVGFFIMSFSNVLFQIFSHIFPGWQWQYAEIQKLFSSLIVVIIVAFIWEEKQAVEHDPGSKWLYLASIYHGIFLLVPSIGAYCIAYGSNVLQFCHYLLFSYILELLVSVFTLRCLNFFQSNERYYYTESSNYYTEFRLFWCWYPCISV